MTDPVESRIFEGFSNWDSDHDDSRNDRWKFETETELVGALNARARELAKRHGWTEMSRLWHAI